MSRQVNRGTLSKFAAIVLVLICLFLWHSPASSPSVLVEQHPQSAVEISNQIPSEIARNETLGFETILALSLGTKWRVRGLNAAASETGLKIKIPHQPLVNQDEVDSFAALGSDKTTKPSRGAAAAWMAHLNLLTYVVRNNFQTALIIEDDVDWALEIKEQMATLSEKVREYTDASSDDHATYGSKWDILWLGHCGEWWNKENPPNTLSWPDATAGRREDWRGVYLPVWLMDLPEGQRSIWWSVSPICTYAYAVSRIGASKILEWAGNGQAEAFDIKLRDGCQAGGLKCISVVDQLFHHYRPPPELGQGSEIEKINRHSSNSSDEDLATVPGSTAVILHSARCKALFGITCLDTSTMSERPFRRG